MKVVLASGNPGKVREIQAIAGPALELVLQATLDITEAAEPHPTFVENALAKARHASRAARLPALADDSGLCVGALGGEPGARVVLFDNVYIDGSSTPIAERDAAGNTYQLRPLADGSTNRVLKNFPTEGDLRAALQPHAAHFSYRALEYYWLVEYDLK